LAYTKYILVSPSFDTHFGVGCETLALLGKKYRSQFPNFFIVFKGLHSTELPPFKTRETMHLFMAPYKTTVFFAASAVEFVLCV
jgi:hypothetical protein